MLYIIISEQKPFRIDRVSEIIARFEESELIAIDDAMLSLPDLEQFLYPSLFTAEVPIVHGKFLLDAGEFDAAFAKKLVASPTVFIFEELTMSAATITMLKSAGATTLVGEKIKSKKVPDDIFAATVCITAKDKKSRWLAYRAAIEKQPIEAILGILYWKVRSLAAKGTPGNAYEKLYRDMLEAQTKSWRSGAPLEALIEQVILAQ